MAEGEEQGPDVWELKGSAEHGLGATHHYPNGFNELMHFNEMQMTEGNDDKQAALTNAAHIFIRLTTDTTLHICITKSKNMQASCLYH